MNAIAARFLSLIVILPAFGPAYAQKNLSGTPEIKLALEKLNVTGSVLFIAAHPDDENTAVLAYYARGRHMRTAYLSATRGEGGQNLIGPEQGDLLGILRTQELLGARRIDGAEQFFTRAIDFGFSKTAAETLEKWGHDNILSDMVWVIRRYRPDVIILRFSGTSRDGHGQHQASAMLGKEAFFSAADPSRFPEQLRYATPWKATRLMFNLFSFGPDQEKEAEQTPNKVVIDTGKFDPVLGKSYSEIAGISRSMHRSQGMGAPERRGSSKNYLITIAGEPAHEDAFDGVDTTWARVPGGAAIGRILSEASRTFVPEQPEQSIPLLLEARRLLVNLKSPAAAGRLEELDEAVALCAGLWLDADAGRYAVTPGDTVQVKATAVNRSRYPMSLAGLSLGAGAQGAVEPLPYNIPVTRTLDWKVPAGASYSQPFWLARPHDANIYSIGDQQLIGVADSPPLLRACFHLRAGDAELQISRPVNYRYVDRLEGELTRSLIVVPEVAVNLSENVLVFPSERSRGIHVQVKANRAKVAGEIHLELETGWKAEPAVRPFSLTLAGDQQELSFELTPPHAAGAGRVRASALVDGKTISSAMDSIAYSHIRPQAVFPESTAKLERADIRVLARRVGYVMGAGDDVPDALRQLGCEVVPLGAGDLRSRNLTEFDAIVTGVRAYNVRPDLRANAQRLLDYVDDGGTLIVQYNVAEGGQFGGPATGELAKIGPFPIKIGRGRVTVEEAPVQFPDPRLPVLNLPNHISEADFAGWIQERGLYFASEWDSRYKPVLETHDPGEKPLEGGMLFARYGKGVYIFSAYSWFRELPAGVPGAYRIFANMLSAGKAPSQPQTSAAAGVR